MNTPFVLHKHDAIKAGLHYDLRIKYPDKDKLIDFVLKKILNKNSRTKRLAVIRAEDHDLSWLDVKHMEIPDDEYGAGVIDLVEKGNAEVLEWTDKKIKLNFSEDQLNGEYNFIFISKSKSNEIWVLIVSEEE